MATISYPENLHFGEFFHLVKIFQNVYFQNKFSRLNSHFAKYASVSSRACFVGERLFIEIRKKSDRKKLLEWSSFIGCSIHVQQVYATFVKEIMKKSPAPSGVPKESRGSSSSSLRRVLGRAAFSSLTRQNNNETSKSSSTGSSK